jgi:carboxylesterase type B
MGASASMRNTPEIPSRQVMTKYGPVEGKRIIHIGDRQVDAFLGIPFAKPPLGDLRFQVRENFTFKEYVHISKPKPKPKSVN